MHIHEVAPGLTRDPAGFWVAPEEISASYPLSGHDDCLAMEEESFWFAHRNQSIVAAVRRHPPADGPLFDIGAGNGYVSAALQQAGVTTIAFEPRRAGATNAAARHVEHVVCGGLPSSAVRTGTAGAIGLFDVLEHVNDDRGLLGDLRPYLEPGGRLYITVPAYPRLWSENDVRSGHFRRYTLDALRCAVTAAGYDVEYATHFFSLLPLPILVARTLGSKAWRGAGSAAAARRQHAVGGAMLRRVVEACLRFEIRRIERGASIAFGSSCLLVAAAQPLLRRTK